MSDGLLVDLREVFKLLCQSLAFAFNHEQESIHSEAVP